MAISWFNCWNCVDSCWLVSESCWLVSSSCWLVSSSCITIDLIGKQPVLFSCTFLQNSSGRLLLDFVEYLYLEPFFVSLDKFVLASTINSHNFVIICLNKPRFYFFIISVESLVLHFLKPPVLFSCAFAGSFQETKQLWLSLFLTKLQAAT